MEAETHSTFSVPISILITPPQPPQYYNRTIIILCYITDIICSTLKNCYHVFSQTKRCKQLVQSSVPTCQLGNWFPAPNRWQFLEIVVVLCTSPNIHIMTYSTHFSQWSTLIILSSQSHRNMTKCLKSRYDLNWKRYIFILISCGLEHLP